MVKIRLSRTGRKNLATYRIVISHDKEKRDSKAIEYVGYYLPHDKKSEINADRVKYWLSVGAQPTETVRTLLVKQNIMEAPKYKRVFSKKPGKQSAERKAAKTEKAQ